MKKLLYMIILMVVVASLSGCNKIEQEQESKMEVNSVTENEVEANNIEESVSGYAASFPENYTAVVENVEFDMEIVKPQIISGDFRRLFQTETPVTVCGQ